MILSGKHAQGLFIWYMKLEDEIAAAKADIEGIIKAIAEVDTVSIKNAIADCGKNKAQLIRSITKSNQRNEVLLNEEARQRARNAALAKAYKSLYLRLGKTNQLVSKTSTEIENQERSIQDLDDAIQVRHCLWVRQGRLRFDLLCIVALIRMGRGWSWNLSVLLIQSAS